MSEEDNAADLQFQIAQQVAELAKNPNNITVIISLVDIYLRLENGPKARDGIDHLKQILGDSTPEIPLVVSAIDCLHSYWIAERYHKKGSLRLNISTERKQDVSFLITAIELNINKIDAPLKQPMQLLLADLRLNTGRFQDALAIYSDLISAQATDVDLAAVIFKSAIALVHIGGNNPQAIEYLDYLVDEPPVSSGYGTMHVLALLAVLYEKSGEHYAVLLEKTYASLQEAYAADIEKGKKPVTNQKKLQEQFSKRAFSRSSEIWEMLVVQAVDRCEYVFAIIALNMACDRCPSKGSLHHLLAELLYLTGDMPGCIKAAEKSFQINPQNADLKNLLLHVNPDKWQDRIRSVPAATKEIGHEDDLDDKVHATRKSPSKKLDGAAEGNWFQKLATTANVVIKDSLMAIANSRETAEQKAKAAADKEKRRKERKEKRLKEQAEREAKLNAAAAMGLLVTADGKIRKRDPLIDGPAKPPRPDAVEIDIGKEALTVIRDKAENIHYYEPILKQLAAIQDAVKRDEMAWIEAKKKAKAKTSKKQS